MGTENRLSFTTMSTPDWSGRQAIEGARHYGYDGVDLRVHANRGEITLEASEAEIAELRGIAEAEGVALPSLLAYNAVAGVHNSNWLDMRDSILRHVDLAHALGAGAVRLFLGSPETSGEGPAYADRTAELLSGIMPTCQQAGVTLFVQNHGRWASLAECFEMVGKVDHLRMKIGFSPEHVFSARQEVSSLLREQGRHVAIFYIADARRKDPEEGLEELLPGEGDIPLKEHFADLQASGPFSGWLTFKYEKIWVPELEEPEVSLPRALAFMRAFLAEQAGA